MMCHGRNTIFLSLVPPSTSNYDYYLSLGLRPLVELSFMPIWMASNDNRIFQVKCAGCPPKDFNDWHRLVNTTVKALVARYGLDEVRTWNFEPWIRPLAAFPVRTRETVDVSTPATRATS